MSASKVFPLISDLDLLSSIKMDDRKAFETLYKRYAEKLYHSAYNLLRNKEVCEDIVQELFVNLWAKRHQLMIADLPSYLKMATKNRVVSYIRTKKVSLDITLVEDLIVEHFSSNPAFEKDIQRILQNNISQLPVKCREVFTLSRIEYLSNKQIAERLNISIKTVENQMTIALRHLRAGLKDYLPLIIAVYFKVEG